MRPDRYDDYIYEYSPAPIPGLQSYNSEAVKNKFPTVIPFHIVDDRLLEFALIFPQNPDSAIKDGFRRLETIVSERASIHDEVGVKLFSKAFLNEDAPLTWDKISKGEKVARAQMFTGVFGAYRNPRAHKEKEMTHAEDLREFLLLNELYLLEASAVKEPDSD